MEEQQQQKGKGKKEETTKKEIIKEQSPKQDKPVLSDNKEVKLEKINTESVKNSQENKIPEKKETKKEVFSPISTYNGDSCELYNWSQGTTDVSIQIKLPENTGAKKVSVIYILDQGSYDFY